MSEKLIKEELFLQPACFFDGDVRKIISQLQELLKQYSNYENMIVEQNSDYNQDDWGDASYTFKLFGERKETEQEIAKRLAKSEKQKERNKKYKEQKEKQKKTQREKDFEELEKLAKKLGCSVMIDDNQWG